MKLFIDDFRPAPIGWMRAKTVTEAISMIANSPERIEVVSLDHDIEGSQETFMAVAYYLAYVMDVEKTCGENVPAVNLHTGNPVAMDAMRRIFTDHRIPVTCTDCIQLYKYAESECIINTAALQAKKNVLNIIGGDPLAGVKELHRQIIEYKDAQESPEPFKNSEEK